MFQSPAGTVPRGFASRREPESPLLHPASGWAPEQRRLQKTTDGRDRVYTDIAAEKAIVNENMP